MDEAVRPIIRCPKCNLRQFQTHDGNCRRCHELMIRQVTARMYVESLPKKPPKVKGGWGEMFAMLRQERGLSQQGLANRARCARTFISKIERYYEAPSLNTIKRFASALDMPFNLLLTANDGRGYYCEHFLFCDSFLAEIYELAQGFDQDQWQLIADAVRGLAHDHQATFDEWQRIEPTTLEVQSSRVA